MMFHLPWLTRNSSLSIKESIGIKKYFSKFFYLQIFLGFFVMIKEVVQGLKMIKSSRNDLEHKNDIVLTRKENEDEYDLEKLEPYLEFYDQIQDEGQRNSEKLKLIKKIGFYVGQQQRWESLKSEGYQHEKKTFKRQFEAELKKQIDITKKFLIRLDVDLPILVCIPTISDEAKNEVIGFLHSLEEINVNEEVNKVLYGERPVKKDLELEIRNIFKKYKLKGVEDAVRDLIPMI